MIKRNLPLMITIGVFVLGYLYCLTQFPGFASTRVICNILTDNAFLGIIAVGMTFVILSGGIDLSVGSVIAFTGVFLAKVIGDFGLSPLLAFPLVLVMGCAFGAFMGLLIDALKIPAFIITLAGMFFLRGVSYLISEESIPINHPVYDTLSSLAWKIPGGGRLSAMGLLMLAVVVIGIFLAHRTRFGNQVYAIGGNATSANLMGISTRSTTIRIYMLSTGLATLAGIVFSIYTQAGYALAGVGVDLDAIASVVIGGTLLSGGVGTVLGTLFGVAIQGLIQTYINFDGTLRLMVDENRHRYFVVYFYSITAWINGAVGESSEFASDKSQHCAAIKTPLRVERRRRLRVRELTDKAFDIFNHMVVADKERTALVQGFRDDIQNTLFAIARFTARLFRQECHRVALIKQTQFAVRVAGGAWVEINTAFQQVTVEIRDQ